MPLIRAIADLHGHLPPIDACDVLVLAGDLCPPWVEPDVQRAWLSGPFAQWLNAAPVEQGVVAVAGNHDECLRDACQVPKLPWSYLQDAAAELAGLNFRAAPWTPPLAGWWVELPERELEAKWPLIPSGTDVLVTHTPARLLGDAVPAPSFTGKGVRNVGSASLRWALQRVEPQLHLCGHVHEGHGIFRLGPTVSANVTVVDSSERPRYQPMAFNVEPRSEIGTP